MINAFISGLDVESSAELPGWQDFRTIIGADEESRSLYVDMLESEWAFLDTVYQNDPSLAGAILSNRCQSLQNALRARQAVSVGSVAALLLVGTRENVSLASQPYLFSFCYMREFDRAVTTGPMQKPLRKLLGNVVSKDLENGNDSTIAQRLFFSLRYELTEGLPAARKIVGNRNGIAHLRMHAVLLLGKLGNDQDMQLVENLLDDRGVIASFHRVNNTRITTQVRDIALASLLMHEQQDFVSYGLPPMQEDKITGFRTISVGFPSDTERDEAIAKWRKRGQNPVVQGADAGATKSAPSEPVEAAESDASSK